jgi:hypothetical protein
MMAAIAGLSTASEVPEDQQGCRHNDAGMPCAHKGIRLTAFTSSIPFLWMNPFLPDRNE